MLLTVLDRIVLLELLEGQPGDYTTLRMLREVRDALSFTSEQYAQAEFSDVDEDGQPLAPGHKRWLNDYETEVAIPDPVHRVIVQELRKRDGARALTDVQMRLYERFVIEPEQARILAQAEAAAKGRADGSA